MNRNTQLTYGLGGLGVLLGSFGLFLLSGRGRELARNLVRHLENPDSLEQLTDATQAELDRIQQTLNAIAERLQVVNNATI